MGSAFRSVPRTGVIYVTTEAQKRGFRAGDPDWCNLGQGQPETGPLPGAPARVHAVDDRRRRSGVRAGRRHLGAARGDRRPLQPRSTDGACRRSTAPRTSASRAAGAPRSRAPRRAWGTSTSGTSSPTTPRTRSCSTSSRRSRRSRSCSRASAATRSPPTTCAARCSAAACRRCCCRTRATRPASSFAATSSRAGSRWRASSTARCCSTSSTRTTSGRRTAGPGRRWRAVESAARYVEDVDRDPVVIFDGLTKNWRYPGWRVTWTVGPKRVIEAVASAGSFLDGGGSKPLQRAAIPLLEDEHVIAETQRDPGRVPRQARSPARRPGAPGHRHRCAARGHVLRLGQGRRACRRRSTTAWASSAPRSTRR